MSEVARRLADASADAAKAEVEAAAAQARAVASGQDWSLVERAIAALTCGHASETRQLPEVRAVLDAADEVRRECILELAPIATGHGYTRSAAAGEILSMVARRQVTLSALDVRTLLTGLGQTAASGEHGRQQASGVLKILVKRIEASAPSWSAEETAGLAPLLDATADFAWDRAVGARLRRLVPSGAAVALELIGLDDDFGARARAVVQASCEDERAVGDLLALAAGLPESGKPSRRWLAAAADIRSRLADPATLVGDLLDALLDAGDARSHSFVGDANEGLAVGMVRFAAGLDDPSLLPKLRRLALKTVIVIGGRYGHPRSMKLANAAAHAMAGIAAEGSVTELLALERAVRHGSLLKQIDNAITALAASQGMTREDLLESTVPRHDLDADGRRDVQLSRGTARVTVAARAATLTYVDERGSTRKSVPAALKTTDAATLTALRAAIKDMRGTIAGERHRLEGLLALDRRWRFAGWRANYLDHPITGPMARGLIWGFRGRDGADLVAIPVDAAAATTSAGERVAIPADAEVRLWHPIDATDEEVRAWRRYLLDEQIAQPCKQAFRETYVLTPAEAQTRIYSNRFAAHVFRQPQARALMNRRGWSAELASLGAEYGLARRVFEPFAIRAEFDYEAITDLDFEDERHPYCTSDQVRFHPAASERRLRLADVPPLVFTEAMRDVDLFIGVTSIGADPQWLDRAAPRRLEPYWQSFGFGPLNEPAKVRREVLEQLLPRLAIADRCRLEQRYLVVRGDLRTYRIHLGSTNVLMSPNDRYLCVVTPRHPLRGDDLFLPFDDDPGLSAILSKAFLLASDTTITDESIVTQIRGR